MKVAFNNFPIVSLTNKPIQLPKNLKIIKKFKFATESSKRPIEQQKENQKQPEPKVDLPVCKNTPAEEEEDFRDEIEKRFQQSTVNATYCFPRRNCASDSESDEESLTELEGVLTYDLRSQNERNYGETQIFLSPRASTNVNALKKIPSALLLKQSVQEDDENAMTLNLPAKLMKTYDDRVPNKRDHSAQKVPNESSGLLQKQSLKKLEFESFDYRGREQQDNTPETNYTANCTPSKGSSNNHLPEHASINPPPNSIQQANSPFQRRIVKTSRLAPNSNHHSMKELPVANKAVPTNSSNLNAVTTAQKGATQVFFFPCKNKPETSESVTKLRVKQMNNSNSIIRVQSRGKESGTLKLQETSSYFIGHGKSPRVDNGEKGSICNGVSDMSTFSSYIANNKAEGDASSVYQLRNTSNLYSKTRGDLLRKIKTNHIDYTPIRSVAREIQEANSSQAIRVLKTHSDNKVSSLSPRVHNGRLMSPRVLNPKGLSEFRVSKLGLARANPSIALKPNNESSLIGTPRHMYQQTPKAQPRNSNLRVLEKKNESTHFKLDLKNVTQKNGVMSDRPKVESLISLS